MKKTGGQKPRDTLPLMKADAKKEDSVSFLEKFDIKNVMLEMRCATFSFSSLHKRPHFTT